MTPIITAYDWVPDFAKGLVRDQRVRWALEEVGQPYDTRYLSQGTQKRPEHRQLQPFGQVPTYQRDGLTLFESGAIVLHIAQTHDGLLPADDDARARAIEWLFAALNTVEVVVADYAIVTIFEGDKPWAAARKPVVVERIDERLGELAARLGDGEWLDDDFTVGDLMMVSVLRQLRGTGIVERHGRLADYVARGQARPAFQRAMDAQMAGFTGTPPGGWAKTPEKEDA